ncbi:hypothetical protein AVEN_14050-1 [Araneus ventricosus]|uniref:T-ag D1-type domain-containing protein n=1 Tax=Araneus ventricosus TaxID=182803 RepID=A0A4Y2PJD9_ARAVE|nr:hypothetical protein AVEN_14050-1 [Araneus ventricosus]
MTIIGSSRYYASLNIHLGVKGVDTLTDFLWWLTSDYRIADVKKECRKVGISPLEAFYATKVGKYIEFCKEKYGQPKEERVKYSGNASTSDHSKKMNYKMLSDFAIANEITDPYELMYDYAHLSTACDRSPSKITNEHESDHVEHLDNARHFEHFSDKKRIAKYAVESVIAKLLLQTHVFEVLRILIHRVNVNVFRNQVAVVDSVQSQNGLSRLYHLINKCKSRR